MNSKQSCDGHITESRNRTVRAFEGSKSKDHLAWSMRFAILVMMIAAVAVLSACSTGSGGDNGRTDSASPDPFGLNFSYPFDGQQDVPLDAQMVVVFPNGVQGDVDGALRLQIGQGNDQPTTPITVVQDDNQPNILRLIPDGSLKANSNYRVVANRRISDGDTFINEDVGLFSFRTRPLQGSPNPAGFDVVETTPGNTNPVTGAQAPFTQFNALRVRFSEPVNPATVTQGESFTFTGPNGPVDGRLTVLGRNLTFDPVDDLTPGSYTVTLDNTVTSVFDNTLPAYSETKNVISAGQTATENLTVTPTANDLSGLPDSALSGTPDNVATISSQLIGVNNQIARDPDDLGGVQTTLAQPGLPGFGDAVPAVIRAGQKVRLTGLNLRLNGDVQTPIASGPIDTTFINDADVYLMASDFRNVAAPTAVRLRFDLGIATLIDAAAGASEDYIRQALANGVFNQTALNIQAAGLAIPQDNGNLRISAVGSFPINVNRTGGATVDLALTLVLPAGDQDAVQPDQTAPIITAQSPSSCLYVFGTPAYNAIYDSQGVAPTALPEQICTDGDPSDSDAAQINSFPIDASPAIVFSEPIDPASVNPNSVQLTGATDVPFSLRVEGTSVVIDPDQALAPDTEYTISLGAGEPLTDLAGNPVAFSNPVGPRQSITFTTEPLSLDSPTAPLLGTLTPGIPCALDGGDFMNGGDSAGNCVGGSDNGTAPDYPVFQNPAGVAVDGVFSKLVNSSSIVLADGCLTAGGDANTVADATVAVQEMDGSGQCVGAVPGEIALANPGEAITRAFTFRPEENFVPGTRYWIVVCGTDSSACTSTITDTGGRALNTTPIAGTGSNSTPAAGGPDIIMPFDAIDASQDYYTNQFTLPESDTNGNGRLDDAEIPQPGNRSLLNLTLAGLDVTSTDRDDGAFASYLALARPIALRGTLDDCSVLSAVQFDDGSPAVGTPTPDQCIQASLLPGGINSLTAVDIPLGDAVIGPLNDALLNQIPLGDIPLIGGVLGGVFDGVQQALDTITDIAGADQAINTGRILLRFPNASDNGGLAGQPTQSGFIVEKCTGTFPEQTDDDGNVISPATPYDFEPCFAASLNLVANAPDGQGLALDQQSFTANIVGPVAFEQNGRLAISVRNTNTITLNASALPPLNLPATATISPAQLNFQLVGNATHGGRAFPNR